ncbi:2-keto-4-pentenoate hydratase/2-oxohepta-3-ene-1,7-dioic acid hydratase (catechol pathway) [Maridesulfovibrio ferrireducens]|uniref:2-keto-4-pentenoate hydratase/2-oxohepta-3-ene-1,7-dioic acid hydratase (Catechol pathway) n=1 Tax=Maridesulfovibrio ferrireducens TaxID=246191 RepID=A0A1G9GUK6_9BACT|nr:fumarylacetoacetate hydrolase family protein [Maridesulfovibrio ferrireducens]SDL04400.1 2-keto-4-pentenoate hydratase/2-oxohepta-3-ene-1,7-dioic acid hydratase (catechol pathway) [Maridesulfovibrio ferrireducens]
MKVFRIKHNGAIFYATFEEGDVFKPLLSKNGNQNAFPISECTILPIAVPSKIICAGLNYKEHARELNMDLPEEPLIFLKPPSSVIGNGGKIIIPAMSEQVDYEGELAIVIGQAGKNILPENAAKHVFGYTCANDVTARDLQKKDKLFARAKGFDTFAPIGPCIETAVADPNSLTLRTSVNGKVRQEGNTSDMIYSPSELISFISHVMTLTPGDVILTGTPPGIGTLSAGDSVEVEIEGIGILTNTVVKDESIRTPVQ